jgi:hypothetical protein
LSRPFDPLSPAFAGLYFPRSWSLFDRPFDSAFAGPSGLALCSLDLVYPVSDPSDPSDPFGLFDCLRSVNYSQKTTQVAI